MPKKGFEFQFKNPTQDAGDALTNVLFINDAPSESDVLRLEVAAVPDVTLTLKPVDDDAVGDSNYHFKLTCRPATLALPEGIALDASHAALWAMVCIPETAASAGAGRVHAPGDVDFYFLYKGDSALEVKADAPLRLTLKKVGAASKGGTRPTILQLTLNKRETDFDKFVVLAGPPGDYNLTENANLDLIAPRGQSAPTLTAGFASSDVVLNDGDTESYLLLRIVNNGLLAISLAPAGSTSPTRLTLRLAADDDTSRLWALGTVSQVSSILIPGKPDSTATDPNWPGKDAWTVESDTNGRAWTLVPRAGKTSLAPDEAIEVPISKIVTGHATGRTPLRIGYSGLPGFGEGELVAYIQKYPLVYADHLINAGKPDQKRLNRVGIGTDSPSAKLTVETTAADEYGIVHTDGTVTLATVIGGGMALLGTTSGHPLMFSTGGTSMLLTSDGKVGINVLAAPVDPLVVGTIGEGYGITHANGRVKVSTRLDDSGGHLGTQSSHPLHFFTSGGAPQVTLKTDGTVGIGTTSPSEKLHVEGHLRVNGEFKNRGPFVFRANTDDSPAGEDLAKFMDRNDKEVLTLKSDGKLGIGTTTPGYPVELKAASSGEGFVHTHGERKLATFIDGQGCWLGTLSNDHLSFFTNDSQPLMTLQTNGRLWLREKPIQYKTYTASGDNPTIGTDYKVADWIAIVAGFYVDHSEDEPTHMKVWPASDGTHWQIQCAIYNTDETTWKVRVVFIRRDLADIVGSL